MINMMNGRRVYPVRKYTKYLHDIAVSAVSLVGAFGLSLLFQYIFDVQEHITTIFVFAVFLISLLTEGYICGVFSAITATIAVNYAFTFPFFSVNFAIPVNLISGIIMIAIAILTGALTTKLKQHKAMKAESERERMRANLLRAVSHDLRTPLTTIYGSGTTLLENNDILTQEQKIRIITGIKEDSEWLIRMVENLLSVTRIDSGRVEIVKAPTVLEELIDSVMVKFQKRYPEQKIEILLPEEMVIIPMDAMLIEQVVINILENAVQHAVGMTCLTLQVYISGEQAVFEIIDDGCGIEARRLETIFSGYNTSDSEIADSKKKNAGIGLSVCASIVKAHGGSIEARNAETGGAVFRFRLDTEEVNDDTE